MLTDSRLRWVFIMIFLGMMVTMGFAQDEQNQIIIEMILEDVDGEIIEDVLSPDEQYTVQVVAYPCTPFDGIEYAYEQMQIINNETDDITLVFDQLINCGGLGAFGLATRRWLGDYLYFTDSRDGQPDGIAFGWRPTLLRYNLITGERDNIGYGQFSYDAQYVASFRSDSVIVYEANSPDLIEIGFTSDDGLQVIDVVWLPDTSGLLIIEVDALFDATRSVTTHFNLATQQTQAILDTSN